MKNIQRYLFQICIGLILFFFSVVVFGADQVSLQLIWKNQFQFAGYYVAKELGFYDDAGLDVIIKEYEFGVNVTDEVVSRKVDFGVGRSSLILESIEERPVYLLSAIFQHSPFILLVKKREDLKTPRDLRGKKIMVSKGNMIADDVVDMASLTAMLVSSNVTDDSYTKQKHSFSVDDLISGKTDAITAYISNEPYQMKKKGADYNILAPKNYGFDFYSDILFTSQKFYNENPQLVERFNQASLQGWEYAFSHIDETIEIILKKYNTQNRDKGALRFEANELKKLAYDQNTQLGNINKRRIEQIAQVYNLLGFTNQPVKTDGLIYNQGARQRLVLTCKENSWLEKHPVIRVHNETDWAPFNFHEKGEPQGLSIDYMKLLAETIGIEVNFISGPTWDGFLDMIKKKELDVMLNIKKTEDRQKYLLYTEPYAVNPNTIVSLKTNRYIKIAELYGKTVAFPEGFFFEEVLRKSYPQINRLPVKGTLESLKAVSFGKADAAVGASAVFNHFIREHLLTNLTVSGELDVGNPDLVNLRIGIRNDWQIFQGIIIKAMAAISSEDKIKLQQKWLLRENKIKEDHGELTEKQKSWLAEHQKLRLGFAAGWAPFEFYNKNEVFSGMTSDFIRILNKRLGVEMIPQQGLTWAEMLDKAKNGEIDVISTIVPTEKRREYLNFTKPYLSLPLMVVRRDDAPYISGIGDLKGKVIAVVKGYVTEDYIKQDFPDQKLLALDSTAEVLRAVSEGRADALLENMATVEFEQKRLDINNLKVAASTPYTFQLSYGVRKDWPELVVVLDKALAAFSDQEKGLMLDKWTNVQIEERANWKLVWQIILLGVFVSGCILLVIIIWNRRLAGEVAERKLAEQELLRLKNVAESANSQLQQEIDARKTVTEKLSIEKIFSETLINSLPGIFYLINENGRQIRRNKNHETVTGYSDEEFINLNVLEMFPENQRKLIEKTMSEVLLKEDANVEVKILTKSGAKIPHFFTIRKMTIDNKHFIIGTGSDISELKKIEAELRRKMKELEKFSKMAFGREQMMISLKEEINQLRIELGKEEKYKIVER